MLSLWRVVAGDADSLEAVTDPEMRPDRPATRHEQDDGLDKRDKGQSDQAHVAPVAYSGARDARS